MVEGKKDLKIKIVDFGTAEILSNLEKGERNISYNGTPYYIAPEHFYNAVCAKSDTWSAGVILYMLLTGRPPFNGRSDSEIIIKVRNKKFPMEPLKQNNVSE